MVHRPAEPVGHAWVTTATLTASVSPRSTNAIPTQLASGVPLPLPSPWQSTPLVYFRVHDLRPANAPSYKNGVGRSAASTIRDGLQIRMASCSYNFWRASTSAFLNRVCGWKGSPVFHGRRVSGAP